MADDLQFSTQIAALEPNDLEVLRMVLHEASTKRSGPNAFLFSMANAGKAAADVAYVKQRFRNFLQRLVDLSRAAQPPGAHAANGFFHDWVVTDRIIASMAAPPTIPLGPEAQRLFDVYRDWYHNVIYRVFKNADNVEDNRTWDFLKSELGAIIRFAIDLVNAIFGDDGERRKATARLSEEFGPLVQHLNDNGNMPRIGRHMNGWIAKFSADTAFFSLTLLNQNVPANTPGELGRIADVIRAMLAQLNRLETNGHNPWLKGGWQLQYQATLQAAILGLDAIPTLPSKEQREPDSPVDVGPLLG